MTFTILASVSLLALVSTARPLPLPSQSDDHSLATSSPSNLQNVVQSVLKSHAGDNKSIEDCLDCHEDLQVHLTSVQEVQEYLSHVDHESLKALVHLDGDNFHSPDEKELYDLLNRLEEENGRRTPVPDELIDSLADIRPSADSDLTNPVEENNSSASMIADPALHNEGTSPPSTGSLAIALVSAAVALLAFGCIAAVVYTAEVLRSCILSSRTAWQILPKLEQALKDSPGGGVDERNVPVRIVDSEKPAPHPSSGRLLAVPSRHRLPIPHKWIEKSMGSDNTPEQIRDDFQEDEKFYDADSDSGADSSAYCTPLIQYSELRPEDDSLHRQSSRHSEGLPSSSEPNMSEVNLEKPSVRSSSRPSWSLRATEAKIPTVDPTPASRRAPGDRRRAFAAVPELDAALAMQLRPGLGIGADAAWLVRFVMTLLGWCAVLVSGVRR